jgi:iron complex transport system substrate-binding protein
LTAGRDLYTLHADALARLSPDVILTQDLCQVCALPAGQVEQALDYLGCHADVVSLDPHSLEEVLDSIVLVGQRVGALPAAQALVAQLRSRLAAVAEGVAGLANRRVSERRPTDEAGTANKVAVIEWTDPPFTAGHWVPDLVTAAGGVPVTGAAGQRSTQTTWAHIQAAQPDIVLVAPCGFSLAGATEQATQVAGYFPKAQVWAIDADGLVVRPGPRLVDGVEAIASIVHPGAVRPPPNSVARIA